MKWAKLLFVAIILIICVSCSSFDKYMNDAKAYMVDKEYEKAVEQLNLAIIENPTNKDAIALLENAQTLLQEQIEKNQKDRFYEASNEIKTFLIKKIMTINVQEISINEAKSLLGETKINNEKAISLFQEYDIINKDYSDATKSIMESSEEAVALLENIIENIIEPLPSPDTNATRRDRYSSRLNSNDSRIKASYNMINIEDGLNNFEKVYVKIMRNEK